MIEFIFVLWFLPTDGFPAQLSEFETRKECVVEKKEHFGYYLRCIKTPINRLK